MLNTGYSIIFSGSFTVMVVDLNEDDEFIKYSSFKLNRIHPSSMTWRGEGGEENQRCIAPK